MRPESNGKVQRESCDDGDLKALFTLDNPSFSRVDVDAVLRDSLGESRGCRTDEMSSMQQDKPRVRDVVSSSNPVQLRATMLKRMSVGSVCAIGVGLAVLAILWGNNTVLAQVQNAIKKAKSVSFTVTQTVGDKPSTTWKVKLLGDSLCRCEQEDGTFTVLDLKAKKVMEVDPKQSKVRITEKLPVPEEFNILAKLTAPDSIAIKGTTRETELNGKKATTFAIEENGVRYNVWVDSASKLPLEMERAKAESKEGQPEIQEKWTEFRFDEPMDKSHFAFEAPKGFAVETQVAPEGDIADSAREKARKAKEEAVRAKEEAVRKAQEN